MRRALPIGNPHAASRPGLLSLLRRLKTSPIVDSLTSRHRHRVRRLRQPNLGTQCPADCGRPGCADPRPGRSRGTFPAVRGRYNGACSSGRLGSARPAVQGRSALDPGAGCAARVPASLCALRCALPADESYAMADGSRAATVLAWRSATRCRRSPRAGVAPRRGVSGADPGLSKKADERRPLG